MKEWFCTNCTHVFQAGESYAKCCGDTGEFIEEFSPAKHVESLVGSSNGWISIYKQWGNHPLTKDVSQRLHNEGCYSAWIHLSEFIQSLVDELEDLKTE